MVLQKQTILGVSVHNISIQEALVTSQSMLTENQPHIICTLNPEIILYASKNKEYASLLNNADLSLPDGIGVVWISSLIGKPLQERIAGVDFMVQLCELASKNEYTVFFLGGRNGVAEKTERILLKKFPSLHSLGFSEDTDNWRNISLLSQADIIFVALGAPKQEQWMYTIAKQQPKNKILMAVGGSFDIISGVTPRAPVWMRNYGFEWFWRFILEPQKRYKRVYNAVIIFPIKVILKTLFH